VLQMPRYLLHLPIALILSTLAGFTAAQQDEVSISSSLLVSASSGDAEAQYLLGQSLDQGQLFGAEIREAFNWYKESADQGYALAEAVVGQMYFEGRGVPQNFNEGEDYLLRAASKGLSAAQLVLGRIKLESEKFPQAYLLFSLAMSLAEDEESYNEAIGGRGEAETNLQETEITVLQSRATACIESEFEQCDFGLLSLEDLSFLDMVEPEDKPEGREDAVISSTQVRLVKPKEDQIPAELTPFACVDSFFPGQISRVEIQGESYPVIFTASKDESKIPRELADKLGLEITTPNLSFFTRRDEYIKNMSVDLLMRGETLERVEFGDIPLVDSPYLEVSLRRYKDYLIELNYAKNQICLHDKSSIDMAGLANLETRLINSSERNIKDRNGRNIVLGADSIVAPIGLTDDDNFLFSLLPVSQVTSIADVNYLAILSKEIAIEPAQIEGSEFYNFQLDNIQVGPFGLDNVNVIITSYMKEMAERIDINRLKMSNRLYRGSDTLMMGYLGLNELQYFSVILDLEEKQGFIYTPN